MRNINLPKARVFVRCDAFGGSSEEFEPCWLVSARALRNRPLCFQVWIDKYAACYDKIPPHCLYWSLPDESDKSLPLHLIQLWECLSGSIECWQKAQLADVPVLVNLGKGKGTISGHYWFTIDYIPEKQEGGYLDVGDADILEEHKEANIVKLTNGQIAIYPNNRLKWLPISLTSDEAIKNIPNWEAASNAQWNEWWEDSDEMLGNAKWAY
jgi:hypothetical protein